MERRLVAIGAIVAAAAVALGAFGAHALRGRVEAGLLGTFETGVRYQMYHGLGLMVIGLAMAAWPERRLGPGAALLFFGTIVFSGSLYLLVITDARWLGAVTPVGGAALIGGWSMVAWKLLRARGGAS
jgi:uncharacterized membrane protein YgdD (TMEM256/DUF423 family)